MTRTLSSNPQLIRDNGWRQGYFLPPPLVSKLLAEKMLPEDFNDTKDLVMIITQDCDILNPSFDSEPWCEVLVFRRLNEKLEKVFVLARNPRRIHTEINVGGIDSPFEALMREKYRFPREYLGLERENYLPAREAYIDAKNLLNIKKWLAARYIRAAFPDNFNTRWKPNESRIKKLLEKEGTDIVEIFLWLLRNEELLDGEEYEIYVIGTLTNEDFEDSDTLSKSEDVLRRLAEFMEECYGIKCLDFEIRDRDTITLTEVDIFLRFDWLDYLSN